MKRELKVPSATTYTSRRYTLQPKSLWRGNWKLEVIYLLQEDVLCCSPNPYEEGTESCFVVNINYWDAIAAAQIPMKRELKVWLGKSLYQLKVLLQPKSLWRGNWKRQDKWNRRTSQSAAAQIPMKRELKAALGKLLKACGFAAAQIPMKRELKDSLCKKAQRINERCSPNPYEEGTESELSCSWCRHRMCAAAQIPMKRELKASINLAIFAKRKLLQPKSLWRGN